MRQKSIYKNQFMSGLSVSYLIISDTDQEKNCFIDLINMFNTEAKLSFAPFAIQIWMTKSNGEKIKKSFCQ